MELVSGELVGGLGIHKLDTFNKALLDHGVGQW